MPPVSSATACAQQVLHLLPNLTRWARKSALRAGADVNLSLRQFAALIAIREGDDSAGALARRWEVTPAVITGILDRLERRGLVRRQPDPADRRRQRLALTEEGLSASRSVEDALTGELASQLATVAPAELGAMAHGLALLDRSLGAEGAAPSPTTRPLPRQTIGRSETGVPSTRAAGRPSAPSRNRRDRKGVASGPGRRSRAEAVGSAR